MKVLLISADAALRKNLPLMMMCGDALELVLASDAQEAAELACQQRFGAAIVDLHAPGRVGLRVLREARAGLPGIPLAALAMRVYAEYRTACHAAGADFFMDKSGDLRDLAQVVRLMALETAGTGAQ